jgi:excisionase family DNA binding protein
MPPSATSPRLTREDVLDAREVADLLHMPISTALDLARRGVIPGHKLGRRWVFLRDEIETRVRTAPNRNQAGEAPQPPVRSAGDAAPPHSKRYPHAVPAIAARPQPQPFG